MAYDFCFTNPEIKDWFEKDEGEIPVRHFVYLHEHPMVRPNFITEIEGCIYSAGMRMQAKNIKGAAPLKLVEAAEKFGNSLEEFLRSKTRESAEETLRALREVYRLSRKIQKI